MNEIRIVDGSYAVLRDNRVIGVVTRSDKTSWRCDPIVEGISAGATSYVPLAYALREALKFEPS